ncbi:MAG: hypothetical protein AAF633_18840 [Chloroflexota bacterium]
MQNRTIPLALLLITFLLAACQPAAAPAEPTVDQPAAVVSDVVDGQGNSVVSDIQILIPANDLAIGTPRIPFIMMSGASQVGDAQAVSLTAFDLSVSPPEAVWTGAAENYSDYEVPYWVVYPTIEAAGNYGFQADIITADGDQTSANFAVAFAAESISPGVGEMGLASQNRVLADGFELEALTSDGVPDPVFYEKKIGDILANGKPSVIAFNTPAFCQTAICAPVLNAIKGVEADLGDEIDFVHVEIYSDFQELTVDQVIVEWQLQSEPWTYIIDGNGIIQERMAGPVSNAELTGVLTKVMSSE